MKFLTDENVASSVVKDLRKKGFDVKDIKEEKLCGASDKEILKMSLAENRIIITHDKDFNNVLVTNTIHIGIILLRFKNQSPPNVSEMLIKLMDSNLANKIANSLTVVSEYQITFHKH